MSDRSWISYDQLDEGSIAVIDVNHARLRTVEHRGLLVELDRALRHAESDQKVRVVILRGLNETLAWDEGFGDPRHEDARGRGADPTYQGYGGTRGGIERNWIQDYQFLVSYMLRWRELRKITIASVQGGVGGVGLMLMWACDLVLADENATFSDPLGRRFGINGVAYFAHPWEWGFRRAKDILLTGDSLSAEDAYRIGAVNQVYAAAELEMHTVRLAQRIAKVSASAAWGIKSAVNGTQDHMGFVNAIQSSFGLHELNHAHWSMIDFGGKGLPPPAEESSLKEDLAVGNGTIKESTAP